jgi:hypothetical protein
MTYLGNKFGDPNNLGYYATSAALISAYPVGIAGAFALVGATDTFWVWDADTTAWVDSGGTGSSGTVTTVSVVTANGLSGSVANPTTTPAITLTLTCRSETPSGTINGSNATFTITTSKTFVIGIWMNGQFIHPADYSVTGTTITFGTAPDVSYSGLPFTIVYF